MKRKELEFRVTRMPDVAIPVYKPCPREADVGGYGFKTSLENRVSSKLLLLDNLAETLPQSKE